jgi:hypothetical protein
LTAGISELTVSGGKGGSIRIVYAEALKMRKGKGNRNEIAGKEMSGIYDDFLLDGEEGRTFSPLVWRTGATCNST